MLTRIYCFVTYYSLKKVKQKWVSKLKAAKEKEKNIKWRVSYLFYHY